VFLVTSLLLFLAVGTPLALLKNPSDLSDEKAVTLRKLKRRGGDLWRAYEFTVALRAISAGDLDEGDAAMMLDRFCSKASRIGLKPYVMAA
jgi:transposase